ncbi:MAG: NADH:flavin oxidoreductase [Desulfohalobiaceae bacterium]
MTRVFEAARIGGMQVKNRFVRSATWEGMARDDGSCPPELAQKMAELARNEVGLILSSHAFVSLEGKAGPWQLGAHSEEMLPGLKGMASAVHEAGGRVLLQLAHAGSQTNPDLTGLEPIGPSGPGEGDEFSCREMGPEDIRRVTEAFGRGAQMAEQAGFDGVQIHAAHGYLLSQFLSPCFNHRTDEYGGAIEGRARMVLDVLDAIRSRTSPGFPVLIKINAADYLEGGMGPEDSLAVCRMLQERGLHAVELSGGTPRSGSRVPPRTTPIRSTEDEVYYLDVARSYKREMDIPLILVGGIRSFEVARDLVEQGDADFVSLARPLIREPGMVKRWMEGDTRPSACQSDNKCFKPVLAGEGLFCYRLRQESG